MNLNNPTRFFTLLLCSAAFYTSAQAETSPSNKPQKRNWKEQPPLSFHTNNGYSLLSLESGQIITGDDQGQLHYWTPGKRWKHQSKKTLESPVYSLCTNNKKIVAGGYSTLSIIHNQQTSSKLIGHAGPVYACAFSIRTPHKFVSIDHARNLILWDIRTKLRLSTYQLPSIATSLIWHGDKVLTGHTNGKINVWGKAGLEKTLQGHKGTVTSIISIDDQWLISAGEDGAVNSWNALKYTFHNKNKTQLGTLKNLYRKSKILVITGSKGIGLHTITETIDDKQKGKELALIPRKVITTTAQLTHGTLIDAKQLVAVDRLQQLRRWKLSPVNTPTIKPDTGQVSASQSSTSKLKAPKQTSKKPVKATKLKPKDSVQASKTKPKQYRSLRLRRAKH